VGTGSPLEAEIPLVTDLPAGDWHFIGDGIIVASVDVTFEIFVRRAGGAEVAIAMFEHHFDPLPGRFDAQPFEATAAAAAIAHEPGDELILRYSGANTTSQMAYLPNGDGALAGGRIPSIDLPE
jgi:hypothetical protein